MDSAFLRVSGFALTLRKIRLLDFEASEKRGFPSLGHWVRFAHTACPSKSASWIFFTLGSVVRFASLALTSYLAHRTLSVRSLFTDPYSFKNPMYIRDAIFFSSPSSLRKEGKSALGLLAFTRFSIPFRNFILKFLHSINLAHMGSFVPVKIRKKKGAFFKPPIFPHFSVYLRFI